MRSAVEVRRELEVAERKRRQLIEELAVLTSARRVSSYTVENLRRLAEEQGATTTSIGHAGGFGSDQVSRWWRGLNAPSIVAVETVAEVLGYEIHLVERESKNGNV